MMQREGSGVLYNDMFIISLRQFQANNIYEIHAIYKQSKHSNTSGKPLYHITTRSQSQQW